MESRTIKYADVITAPHESKKIVYRGPNPLGFKDNMRELLKHVLEIGSPNVHEADLRWDATDGSFYYEVRAKRPEDRWTTLVISMRAWGQQGDDEKKMGSMTIKLKGVLETEIEYTHSIHKSFWWTYSYLFYNRQRRKYFERARKMYFTIENAIREMLGVPAHKLERVTVPKGAGFDY